MQQGFSGLFIWRKIARKTREFKPKTLKFKNRQKKKSLENVVFSRLFGGGGSGIRTHVPVGKRFSRLLRIVVSSGYFMATWLISVPLKALSHKAFCLVLNRSNPNRINSNRTAFLKISLKSLTFERFWRELDTKKLKMQYSEVGLYWREFLP